MPDISMCRNERCDKKKECYRFMAIPYRRRQTYTLFDENDISLCFEPIEEGDKIRNEQ